MEEPKNEIISELQERLKFSADFYERQQHARETAERWRRTAQAMTFAVVGLFLLLYLGFLLTGTIRR